MINDPTFQHYTVIAIVILCSAYLILRVWMRLRGKNPRCGCGDDCGCPTREFKRTLEKSAKPDEENK